MLASEPRVPSDWELMRFVENISPRCQVELRAVFDGDWYQYGLRLTQLRRVAPVMTAFFAEGQPVPMGVLTITQTYAGQGFAGFIWHKDGLRIVPFVSRYVTEDLIPFLMEDTDFHRVETRVMASYRRSVRWIESLGAEKECDLPGFGRGGEQFIQFAWRRDNVRNP